MREVKQIKKIKFKKLTDHQKELRTKVASEIMSGLIASRGQHPLEHLRAKAQEMSETACVLTDALLKELGEG